MRHWDVWDELAQVRQAMDKMVDDVLGGTPFLAREAVWHPLADVCETAEEVIVTVELPGASQENMQLVYDNGHLIISGVRERQPHRGQQLCCHQIEIPYGRFERAIPIRCAVQSNNIVASYQDGFLQVVLPKIKEPTRQKVQVNIA